MVGNQGKGLDQVFNEYSLNPDQWRSVAGRRLGDATCLQASPEKERANGTIYFAGLVVECLLKAELLELRGWKSGTPPNPSKMSDIERRAWGLIHEHKIGALLGELPNIKTRLGAAATTAAAQASRKERKRFRREGDPDAGGRLWHWLMSQCAQWGVFVRYSSRLVDKTDAAVWLANAREIKKCLG